MIFRSGNWMRRINRSLSREIVARSAMLVASLVLDAIAFALFAFGWSALSYSGLAGLLILALGGFLTLVAATLFAFTFLPSRDTAAGPPRGFITVSGMFDLYWGVLQKLLDTASRSH